MTKNIKHGLYHHPSYKVWLNMISRCYNHKAANYRQYGGRGIMVCDQWLSVAGFIDDMGTPPKGLTLERVDVNLDYTPQNCKWADRSEQASNRRDNHRVRMADGRILTAEGAARELGIRSSSMRERIAKHGPDSAAMHPPRNYPRAY